MVTTSGVFSAFGRVNFLSRSYYVWATAWFAASLVAYATWFVLREPGS